MLAVVTLLWGLNWPVMKIGVTFVGPMSFRSVSMLGGLVVLLALIWRAGQSLRVPRAHWGELFAIAAANMAVWYVFAMYGVAQLASGRAAILGYTLPIWSALWGILIFGDKANPRLWFGVLAALAGVVLLMFNEFGTLTGRPIGTISMLIAAACWGYGSHLMRRRKQSTPVLVITFWSLILSFLTCGSLAFLFERPGWTRAPNSAEWIAILYNAILIFGLVQVWWFRLATVLPPVASGLSVMLIPVVGVFSAMLLLGEQPGWPDYVALLCILVAISSVLIPARVVPQTPPRP
jgi:drug/metabolite transporter (DMT)-like permease